MGEVKNNFLRSKMNKDLDDRLIPNGEYRNAENISVGKSENSDVGAIEDILGNSLIAITDVADHDYKIIGVYADVSNERLITFLKGNGTTKDAIRMYDLNSTSSYPLLVEGDFLNFNEDNKIISINLIEDLLFWTDNFNQPRKINIKRAIEDSDYYTTEHSISVAKYYPFDAIKLYKDTEVNVLTVVDTLNFTVTKNEKLTVGMTIVNENIEATEYIKIKSVDQTDSGFTAIEIYEAPSVDVVAEDTLYCIISTMTDGTLNGTNANWPGDPDFLEDKFVRFSYRFKFDDNEYSLFAPFTQIGFIPKQKGYFGAGQEQAAYSSTIVGFFENLINDIKLIIPLPCERRNVSSLYKIKSLDILYKESDGLAVKVLDTISSSEITEANTTDTFFEYDYQSRKPIRTLPSDQIVRVYDKVPVKAKAQEITGNRVIYGNFQDKHTPPSTLSYNVRAGEKIANQYFTDFVELPNHSLKQNRNYQVGFVLSDKYGRSSSVILSSVDEGSGSGAVFFGGSTVYSPYYKSEGDISNGVDDWFGDSLILQLNQAISSTKNNATGTPGLYAQDAVSFAVINPIINNTEGGVLSFDFDKSTETPADYLPVVGESLRGEYVDYVTITSVEYPGSSGAWNVTITTDGAINTDIYSANTLIGDAPDIKYSYNINTLGWYSYRVVVKQNEQDYYNVYLPSVLSGSITGGAADPADTTSYITLINDNINKVPRDLSEVGPDQKQYRSSVRLYGRVENKVTDGETPEFFNTQFYPLRQASTTDIVSEFYNLIDTTTGYTEEEIYQAVTNPIVCRVTSTSPFGIEATNFSNPSEHFQLAVYETEPTVSAIDIFWESTSSGLISDLNYDVLTGFDGAVGFEDFTFTFQESNAEGDELSSQWFSAVNNVGGQVTPSEFEYTVTSGRGIVTDHFIFEKNDDSNSTDFGKFRIRLNSEYQFINDSPTEDVFTFEITLTVDSEVSVLSLGPYPLTNSAPFLDTLPENPYIFSDQQPSNVPLVTFSPAYNGSSISNSNGISWEIDFGENDEFFSIRSNTGEFFVDNAAETPFGVYNGTLSIWDATLNSTPISGSGSGIDPLKSLRTEYDIQIIKGFPQTNISGTETFELFFDGEDGYENGMASATMYYYLTDGENPNDDLTTINADAIAGTVAGCTNYNIDLTTSRKLAGALHQGEMLIGIEGGYKNAGSYNNVGDFGFNIQWRGDPDDDWQTVADMSGFGSSSTIVPTTDKYEPKYLFTAHNVPGEYRIVITIDGDTIGDGDFPDGSDFGATITLYDLHYLNSGGTQGIYGPESVMNQGSSSSNPSNGISGLTTSVYSDNPFPQYATNFFTDRDFIGIFTPDNAGFCNIRDFFFYPEAFDRVFAPKINSDGTVIRDAGPNNVGNPRLDVSVQWSQQPSTFNSNLLPVYPKNPITQ